VENETLEERKNRCIQQGRDFWARAHVWCPYPDRSDEAAWFWRGWWWADEYDLERFDGDE